MAQLPTRSTVPGRGYDAVQVASLFANGEQGFAAYDFSDFSKLYQDAAGTTPVTAVEQPVGRIVGINGVVATQATTTARAKVAARVNLLPQSNNIGRGLWQVTLGNLTTSYGTGSLPIVYADYSSADGELANRIVLQLNGGINNNDRSGMFLSTPTIGPFSVCIKSLDSTPNATLVEKISFNTNGPKIVTPLADGSVLVTGTTSLGSTLRVQLMGTAGLDSADFLIGKASVTLAADAHLPYQRVKTATDYDTMGFPHYALLDGVDDHYTGSNPASNAGFYFAAALSPASKDTARTLFSDAAGNAGYRLRINAANQIELAAGNGTAFTAVVSTGTIGAGDNAVLQAWDDGTTLCVQIGDGAVATVPRPAVATGSSTWTVGRDNGAASGYFNGKIYGAVYRSGLPPTPAQRASIAAILKNTARFA